MVLFVKSAVKHASHRELLRRTWASFSYVDGFKLATIFVTGKAEKKDQTLIDEEHNRYGDILQLNTSDAYMCGFLFKMTNDIDRTINSFNFW